MAHSVTSVNTGEYFAAKYNPVILIYTYVTRRALYQTYLFLLKTNFVSIRRLFGGIFLLLDFGNTPLFIMSLNFFWMDVRQT